MAKFYTGAQLEDAVYHIIWDAEDTLLIVCPYVKLGDYFKKLFEKHVSNPSLHIMVVFGKNDGNTQRSLAQEDFDFFKRFPNVSIVYVANLHAKYYGNERAGVITSINLHDYSFKHNIEYGVFSEYSLLNKIGQSTDQQAWETSIDIAQNGEPVYIKRPVYKRKLLSMLTGGKEYVKSDVLLDETEAFYSSYKRRQPTGKRLKDFADEVENSGKADSLPARETEPQKVTGYCIRTRAEIPFNLDKPYCAEAYSSWAEWKNPDYKEKFCHKTGEKSYGKTSMRHPVL